MEALDDRREYIGSTLVYSDCYGPKEFWRAGRQVSCLCDPDSGLVCAYHGDRARPEEIPR
jgi:hypothetical protein